MSMSKIHCSYCDKEIGENENFIIAGDNGVYCKNCVEENTFTAYSVGGEVIGDETDSEEYNSIEQFEESLKDEIKHWESYLKDYENIDGYNAEHQREFYRSKIRLAKDRYKEYFE